MDTPLSQLVEADRKRIVIKNMADYAEILFSIEEPILSYWKENPKLKDRDVLFAFAKLLKRFDNHKEQYLPGRISISLKEMLVYEKEKGRTYTYGEVVSCLTLLKNIAKTHRSPNGRGYLQWIQTFFEGNLPETEEEILEYIRKYES